jgi:hypothetical protein
MRMGKKFVVLVVSSLFVLVLVAGTCFAQGQAKAPAAAAEKPQTETRKCMIDYMERLGGYFIRGVEPTETLFIVNQNPTVLKKLKESGKTVTIQGHTTEAGADYFFIEKIDGKKYSAAKPTQKKAAPK